MASTPVVVSSRSQARPGEYCTSSGSNASTSVRDPDIRASYDSRDTDYAVDPLTPPPPPSQHHGSSTYVAPLKGADTLHKDVPISPDLRDKQIMYRVRGIPHKLLPEVIKQLLLDELFPGNERVKVEGEPKIIPGEGQDVEQETQIALIQFSEKPEAFSRKSVYFLQCWRGASIDNTFYGFTTLFAGDAGKEIIADIVAVTGPSGHAYDSWKGRDGHKEMWLQDFLPHKFSDCRVMVYGYESDIIKSSGVNSLEDYVNEFLNELDKKRPTPEEKRRPIIFIGHSLGGLIITHSIEYSSRNVHVNALLPLTKAIIFFGTPHRGLGEQATNILDVAGESLTRPALVNSLQVGSHELNFGLRSFINLLSENGPKIITFYEQRETFVPERYKNGKAIGSKGERPYIALGPEEAWVGVSWEILVPVDKDHLEMVKFDSIYDKTFETIHYHMRDVIYSEAEKCLCKTLECAINHGNIERLKGLYKSQMDAQKALHLDRDRNSKPLLHHAVESGSLEVLRTLVELGINLCDKDAIHGNTALHHAISEGRHDMALELVNQTETHWIRNNDDHTPLDVAVMLQKLDIVQLMLNLMLEGETFIDRASAMSLGREEINRADQKGTVVLHRAAMTGNYRIVKELLDNGAMVNIKDLTGTSALHLAAISGNPEIVKALLDMGAMVDSKEHSGFTALHLAIKYDNRRAAEVLLENKADIEAKGLMGSTPLYVASSFGKYDLAALLLQNHANVNARCDNGCDALFAAATGPGANDIPGPQSIPLESIMPGFISTVGLLLRNNADVHAYNDYCATALLGVFEGLLGFLLKRIRGPNSGHDGDNRNKDGVNGGVDKKDDKEQSLYNIEQAEDLSSLEMYRKDISACFEGYSEIVRVLLNHGANIDTQNESWQTPLHTICNGPMNFVKEVSPLGFHPVILTSVLEGYKGMLKILIGRGADVDARDDLDRKPLDILYESMEKVEGLLSHKVQLLQPSTPFSGVSAALDEMAKILKRPLIQYDDVRGRSPEGRGNMQTSEGLISRSSMPRGRRGRHSSGEIIRREGMASPATTANSLSPPRNNYREYYTRPYGLGPTPPLPPSSMEGNILYVSGNRHAGTSATDAIMDALHMAAKFGDPETTRRILDSKAYRVSLNTQSASGNTILHSAIEGGNASVVEILLEKGCSLNIKNKFGYTPLHTAIRGGNEMLVGLLLCNTAPRPTDIGQLSSPSLSSACLDIKDRLGNTALHLAVESGNEYILALILNCKPNLELQRKDHLRALHLAVVCGNEEVVQSLLHHGANVHQDLQGQQTLLHVAARFGNIRVVKVLCRHDRSLIGAQDDSGATPLDIATSLGNLEMINFFKSYTEV